MSRLYHPNYASDVLGGIGALGHERLQVLHRAHGLAPFTVVAARATLGLAPEPTRRWLAEVTTRGWATRVRRGLYALVPLAAPDPAAWLADPWLVAVETYRPAYIGGWSALHHHGLTDQLFRGLVVFTARSARHKVDALQGTPVRVRRVRAAQLFGTSSAWRGGVAVQVSDPERTLVDVLAAPALGGGVRHVADCLEEWAVQQSRDEERLFAYIERSGHGAAYKRLGFLLEERGCGLEALVARCRERLGKGVVALEPDSKARGHILSRWGLRVNART